MQFMNVTLVAVSKFILQLSRTRLIHKHKIPYRFMSFYYTEASFDPLLTAIPV